jgi:nitrate/TMAO reductase-like tetraheme cytochrome c subunit
MGADVPETNKKHSLETSGITHLTSKCHIPEEQNPKYASYFIADFNVAICSTWGMGWRSG